MKLHRDYKILRGIILRNVVTVIIAGIIGLLTLWIFHDSLKLHFYSYVVMLLGSITIFPAILIVVYLAYLLNIEAGITDGVVWGPPANPLLQLFMIPCKTSVRLAVEEIKCVVIVKHKKRIGQINLYGYDGNTTMGIMIPGILLGNNTETDTLLKSFSEAAAWHLNAGLSKKETTKESILLLLKESMAETKDGLFTNVEKV
jgi:hypothetical protein